MSPGDAGNATGFLLPTGFRVECGHAPSRPLRRVRRRGGAWRIWPWRYWNRDHAGITLRFIPAYGLVANPRGGSVMKFWKIGMPLVAFAVLQGCASGYTSFYKATPDATSEAIAERRAAPPPETPIVERLAPDDPQKILAAYAKRGYVMIGTSEFNSGHNESEASAIKQGQVVKADLVLIMNPQYTGSVTTSMPLTTPTTSTSYTSGTATAYGPGGTVNAYGSGTTTTYGTQTTYIPITINRSNYAAVYFVKQKYTLGAFARDLSDSERQDLQTNQGAVITIIVDDTPAFRADVLPGDIIFAVAGQKVGNVASFYRLLGEHKGQITELTLLRHGQKIEKTIQLNN